MGTPPNLAFAAPILATFFHYAPLSSLYVIFSEIYVNHQNETIKHDSSFISVLIQQHGGGGGDGVNIHPQVGGPETRAASRRAAHQGISFCKLIVFTFFFC